MAGRCREMGPRSPWVLWSEAVTQALWHLCLAGGAGLQLREDVAHGAGVHHPADALGCVASASAGCAGLGFSGLKGDQVSAPESHVETWP